MEIDDPIGRLARILFFAGCATIPMLAFRVSSFAVSDLLFILGALLQLAAFGHRRQSVPGPWLAAAALVAVGGCLAGFRADSIPGDLATTVRLVYLMTIWVWQARYALDTRERVWTAVNLFVAGSAISGLAGLLELHGGLVIPGSLPVFGRSPGLTQHVNDQGAVLAAAFPMAVGSTMHSTRRSIFRIALILSIALIAIGLLSSGSVSGMLGAAVGIVVLTLRARSLGKTLVGVLIVGGAFLIGSHFLAHGSLNPLQRFDQATGGGSIAGQDTASTRIQTWEIAWHRIIQNPLVGAGLDPNSELTVDGFSAHNILLLAWSQGGLFTFIGILAAVSYSVRRGWSRTGDGLMEVAFAGVAAAIAYAMTGPVLFDRFFWFPVILPLVVSAVRGVGSSSLVEGEEGYGLIQEAAVEDSSVA